MVTLDDPNDPAAQEKQKMLDQPIYYGKDKEVIRNEGDILKHINFDSYLIESNERQQFSTYEEYKDFLSNKGVESYIKYQQSKLPTTTEDGTSFEKIMLSLKTDVEYEKLINRIRPDVKYYDQSRGD